MTDLTGLLRRTRDGDDEQGALFEMAPDWRKHWWGMPAFEQGDTRPQQRITVNFHSWNDVKDFAQRLGISG